MARPPLPVGTHGKIKVKKVSKTSYVASATYRDYDGQTRPVTKTGPSPAAAERKLKETLRDRARAVGGGGDLTPDDMLSTAAERWYAEEVVASGRLALQTQDRYRRILENKIKPGVGALRIRELTVGASERFLRTVERNHGSPTAKLARTVLAGIAGYCARHDCLAHNPVKDVAAISVEVDEKPAMSLEQVRDLRDRLAADELAVRHDLPDFVDMMLGTGMRISEAAAVRAVDLPWWRNPDASPEDARKLDITGNVVRITGKGLIRQGQGQENNKLKIRTVRLPGWLIEVLQQRIERMIREGRFDENGALFTAPRGGWRDPSNTQSDLRKAFDRAGYPWITSHTFRRTVATLSDRAELPTSNISAQLGHNRQATTHRYVSRKFDDTGVADVMEAVLAAGN